MINVDISNIWGAMSLPDLLKVEAELGQAHRNLLDPQGKYRVKLPGAQDPLTQRILETGRRIRENSRVLVVLGLDSGCRCAQGLVELLQGADRNLTCREEELQILFGNLSSGLQFRLFPHLFHGLLPHGFLADKETVKHPVEDSLFFSGFCVNGLQRGLGLDPIGNTKMD